MFWKVELVKCKLFLVKKKAGKFCDATGVLLLLALKALAQNVQDQALSKKSQKKIVFYTEREDPSSEHEVLHEKLKTVLPALI